MTARRPALRRPARKPERELSPQEFWAREEAAARRRALEEKLAFHIHAWGLPAPEREYRFDERPDRRRWRFDFAWPAFKLAAEVEGLTAQGGRHQRIGGFEADAEKYAEAARAGWQVLRFSPGQVRSGYAVRLVQDVLAKRSNG